MPQRSDGAEHLLSSPLTGSPRPYSIDLTLELERQLDDEPPFDTTHPSLRNPHSPDSQDSQSLADLVTHLRTSLEKVTQERDEFSALYAESQVSQAELKATLNHVSEKCIRLEHDLSVAVDKQKDDADAVIMLRSKLEDSRRALMRLQTESRRMSQSNLLVDTNRAGQLNGGGSGSGKRASFTPLTGSPSMRGHRRIVSVSDSGLMNTSYTADQPTWSPPQNISQEPSFRRMSGFFGRASPSDLPPPADAPELEELRKELQAVKEQLEETRHELTEAQEAREASETCVGALRTFISEHSIGLDPEGGSRASTISSTSGADQTGAGRGWGFKLWRSDSVSSASVPMQGSSSISSESPSTSSTSSRFGAFFAPKAKPAASPPPLPPRPGTRPPPQSRPQESVMYHGSDSSSIDDFVTEPISPVSEVSLTPNVIVQVSDDSSELLDYTIKARGGGKEAIATSGVSEGRSSVL